MKRAFFSLLSTLQAPRIFRSVSPSKVPIIMYHGFADRPSAGLRDWQGLHLHVEQFRRQLRFLTRNYNVVPLQDAVDHYATGAPLPPRPVVISIDDGYRNVYDLAFPALREFGAHATFFVTTDFVDRVKPLWHDRIEYLVLNASDPIEVDDGETTTPLPVASDADRLASMKRLLHILKAIDQERRDDQIDQMERTAGVALSLDEPCDPLYAPVDWDQVAEMSRAAQITIGCHTKSHVILSRCSSERIASELSLSKQAIEMRTQVPCNLFCYPNGALGDFDDTTTASLKVAGFDCGLTTVPGLNGPGQDVFRLVRFGAPPNLAEFEVTLSGLRGAIAGLARRQRHASG